MLRIYSPALVLLALIVFIYSIYIFNYVLVLVEPHSNLKLYSLLLFGSNIFSQKLGIWLFIIMNWLFFWLIVSFLRTAFSDPGYFPDPLELEYNILKKNLDFPEEQVINKSDYSIDSNTSEDKKRKKILKSFHNFIDDGPLTSSEYVKHIEDINKYLASKDKNNSASELCLTIEGININNDDVFDNYRGYDLSRVNLCNFCLRLKIIRSHHCKQCGKCVLKMDHHCPWVANCIGFRNHKYFCLLVIYGFFSSLLVFLTFWEVVLMVNFIY